MSITLKNLQSALAGESMANIKYRYFAKIARQEGYQDVSEHFENTAKQELLHAWGHLELLIGKPTTGECYALAANVAEELAQQTDEDAETAFSIESQAYSKYLYFAKFAELEGSEDAARQFSNSANDIAVTAWKHLEMVIGRPDTRKCLELAIEGETYEFTTMYPEFQRSAIHENDAIVAAELQSQIQESQEHAEQFKKVLALAEKRFAALASVEQRHAEAYQQKLETL